MSGSPPLDPLRRQLARFQDSGEAHLTLEGALEGLALDPAIDLTAQVPHASEAHQTYLRALLLAQDHAAYHIGQVVQVRRLLED